MPNHIAFTDGSSIAYTYDADGRKLRTVHKIGSTTTQTDYCGNVIYENGALKLLLTEKGYVNLKGTRQYYYYLQDHQGNNRMIVDSNGNVKEINHYYPFGGVFAVTGNVQPYKFNGKELDTKKGLNWYDYGARQYDAALGRFVTIDPMTEMYYNLGSYVYCNNNPIRYIDPTGMLYTGYTVDKYGYFQQVNDEGGAQFDVLYNKETYASEKQNDYDETGNKTGIKISKNILNENAGEKSNMSIIGKISKIYNSEGHSTGKVIKNHAYEIKDDKESLAIMNFLGKNTKVEWGNKLMVNKSGGKINLLMTSHEEGTITLGVYQANSYYRKGYQVLRDDHIHPGRGDLYREPSDGDNRVGADILKHSPNAIFRILNQGKYYIYVPK